MMTPCLTVACKIALVLIQSAVSQADSDLTYQGFKRDDLARNQGDIRIFDQRLSSPLALCRAGALTASDRTEFPVYLGRVQSQFSPRAYDCFMTKD